MSAPNNRSEDPYRSYGYFDPFEANRILKRFEKEGIRFQITDASGIERWNNTPPHTASTRLQRNEHIEIFIHFADADKAHRIIEEV
jgi:hypothetical protein